MLLRHMLLKTLYITLPALPKADAPTALMQARALALKLTTNAQPRIRCNED